MTTSRGSDSVSLRGSATVGTFDTAVVTLEVYNLDNCGELPNSEFEFEILTLKDDEDHDVPQAWGSNLGSDVCEPDVTIASD